jgi:5-hydroxyisourate hydrolase
VITTHVLDTSLGRPAAGIAVTLERRDGAAWTSLGAMSTDADGRARPLNPSATLRPGHYRLTFAVSAYYKARGVTSFYPEVVVVFDVQAPDQHYHVPLLLSPFGYSTYRGS